MDRGSFLETPAFKDLAKNTTVGALEKFLGAAIGINENEHRPPTPTRDILEANFRHSLLLSLQDQNDIDSKQRLFHRQGEDFVGTAIRDTLPYFLGAIDEDRLLKQAQLEQARRHLRQLERQMREAATLDTSTYPRANALLDEAKQVGLIDEELVSLTYDQTLDNLRRIARDTLIDDRIVMSDGEDMLAGLRSERQSLRTELERVNADIRSTRTFTAESGGYEREVKEQRARLSSVGLFAAAGHDPVFCPVCTSRLTDMPPTVAAIERSLNDLREQLETVEAENPRLQLRLATLLREEAVLQDRLRENQLRISTRMRENAIMLVQQENFILQARTIGKISQYIETADMGLSSSALQTSVESARAHVGVLE